MAIFKYLNMLNYKKLPAKTEKKVVRILKRIRNTLLLITILLLLIIFKGRRNIHYKEVAEAIPTDTLKFLSFKKAEKSFPGNIDQLRKIVYHLNHIGLYELNNIRNIESFGPITKDAVVFVIFVRGLSINLKFLIVSLAQVQGIEQVLLVFSHMVLDENARNLINTIDFCRVLQIYYPHSTQLHPDEFPGYSPRDCPHDMDVKTAQAIQCTGFLFPDFNGHFRNPKLAEQKLFWWWTANAVFENILGHVEHHSGIVVFLREDLYILKDFLYIILFMKQVCDNRDNCEFLTVECSRSPDDCIRNDNHLEIRTWDLKHEPSVLAFDINVWNGIVSEYELFCAAEDYSWARSLIFLSMKREDAPRYRMMSSVFPRSYKTSTCELERSRFLKNCDVIESVYQILEIQNRFNESLYPEHMEVYTYVENQDNLSAEFSDHGGWSDPRDKNMCSNLTISKIKKVIRKMKREFMKFIGDEDNL